MLDGFPRNGGPGARSSTRSSHPATLDGVVNLVVSTHVVLRRLAVATRLRGLRHQLLDDRPAAHRLDLRRLRRRGRPARGRHRGGDPPPPRSLRGADGAADQRVTRQPLGLLVLGRAATASPTTITDARSSRRRSTQRLARRRGGPRRDPHRRARSRRCARRAASSPRCIEKTRAAITPGRHHRRPRRGRPGGARAAAAHAPTSSATTASRR